MLPLWAASFLQRFMLFMKSFIGTLHYAAINSLASSMSLKQPFEGIFVVDNESPMSAVYKTWQAVDNNHRCG